MTVTFGLNFVTFDASTCKEEVIHAVKPSNRHRSLFYAVVIVSRDVISRFYAVISDVITGSTRSSAVTSSSSTRSSSVTSSTVLRRVELVLKVSVPTSKPSAAIHVIFV